MLSAKLYLKSLGSGNFDCRQNNSSLGYEDKSTYIFNTGIKNIELSDHCLLIGCNPRYDATMINARIRKAYLQNSLDIALLGDKVELTYPYKHLGGNPWVLKQIADGIHPICSTLKASKKPMMILGEHITTNKDFEAISYYTKKIIKNYSYIQDNWHGYNILHTAASRVGGIEIGFIPENNGLSSKEILKKCKVIFLLGADELDFSAINKDAFVVYIGHHGDRGAEIADIVLPSPAFTEKQGTYLNLEGRIQNTYPVMPKLTKAQEEWSIFLKLAKYSKIVLPYKNFYELRQYTMSALHSKKKKLKSKISKKNSPNFSSDKIALQCYNYYLTNSICRNSLTMNMCSKNFKDSNNF